MKDIFLEVPNIFCKPRKRFMNLKPRRDCGYSLYLQPPEASLSFAIAHSAGFTNLYLLSWIFLNASCQQPRWTRALVSLTLLMLHKGGLAYDHNEILLSSKKKKSAVFFQLNFLVGLFDSVWEWNLFQFTTFWVEAGSLEVHAYPF